MAVVFTLICFLILEFLFSDRHLYFSVMDVSVLIYFLAGGSPIEADLVFTKQGLVNGTIHKTLNGTKYKAYLGIPFAEPPIGNLRFKPPIAASPWDGVLNATEEPEACVQLSSNKTVFGSENCLTLNIFTPLNSQAGDNIPVIVYIYGGIFKEGSNVKFGPQKFMIHNIILVMLNHRLGPLGFLSTGDEVVSGNMGLKDQTLAMRWIKTNIYVFGGNPKRITLHGHSSGAMSAHLHMLSPLSKGLFNRVIIQSGTSFSTLAFFDKQTARAVSRRLARELMCNDSSSQQMLDCFLNVKPEIFPQKQEDLYLWNLFPDGIFRPTIEGEEVKDAFLTKVPIKSSYQSMDQELLIGVTSGEGAIFTAALLANDSKPASEINKYYKVLFPITLQYLFDTKSKHNNFISSVVRKHYFGSKEMNTTTRNNITQMFTHGLYTAGTNEAIRKYEGTKYLYVFDYVSNYTMSKCRSHNGYFYGIGHAEEIPLIFVVSENEILLSPEDKLFGQEMITRWVNFAYSGDPNTPFPINTKLFGPWLPSKSSRGEFLRLKINGTMEKDYFSSEYKFWRSLPIFSKFY